MADYRPILYHSQLSAQSLRVRRSLRRLRADVDQRSILLSPRHRRELLEAAGTLKVPCLVVASSVVQEAEEIEKYLRLRYGERD